MLHFLKCVINTELIRGVRCGVCSLWKIPQEDHGRTHGKARRFKRGYKYEAEAKIRKAKKFQVSEILRWVSHIFKS